MSGKDVLANLPGIPTGPASRIDPATQFFIRFLILVAISFLAGYGTGKLYPSPMAKKQEQQNKRRVQQVNRLMKCRALLDDIRAETKDKQRDLMNYRTADHREKFLEEDLQASQTELDNCLSDLHDSRSTLSRCESSVDYFTEQVDKHKHMGGTTANVEAIVNIAVKNTTDAELKELAEQLKQGGKVSRDRVIGRLLAQVAQTRGKLAAARERCHDNSQYDVSAQVERLLPKIKEEEKQTGGGMKDASRPGW